MDLFVGINTASMDIILISDRKELVEEKIKKAAEKGCTEKYRICSTQNVSFSSGFTADISYAYDLQCLEETIRNRLSALGIDIDSPQVNALSSSLAADAYYDIQHYDVSEDYAINEAFRLHAEEISTVQHLTDEIE